MSTWTEGGRTHRTIPAGDLTLGVEIVSWRPASGESRHTVRIGIPDATVLEVYPDDGETSSTARSRTITAALDDLETGTIDPALYILGALTALGANRVELHRR